LGLNILLGGVGVAPLELSLRPAGRLVLTACRKRA